MNTIWNFFENMNELVYASDLETYEIVYMNRKAREVYGLQSIDEVKGKKCYELLQGSSSPCSICTNEQLKIGSFEEWQYFNPVVKKNFMIKDTLLKINGKYYRVELAIDMTLQAQQAETIQSYINNESIINESLRLSLSSTSPDTSINILLEYIGKALKAERIYIFEFKNDQIMDNTYEWCAKDVIPQIDNLQDVPQEIAAIWIERFKDNKNVIIEHLEDTKESDPAMYDLLLPQEIDSLIVSPLIFNNKIIGFFGVDNPPKQLMQNISTLFMILGHFIMSLLRRRDLVMRLEKLSYYDQLTGFKNRHGMDEYISSMNKAQSIGVIYGDVTGLKRVNDTLGHKEGDKLLVRSCDCLKRIFSSDELFRIGGDEFLILCSGITEEELINKINLLRTDLQEHDVVMAIGYIWRPHNDDNIDKLLSEADKMMYKDKRDYYKKLV